MVGTQTEIAVEYETRKYDVAYAHASERELITCTAARKKKSWLLAVRAQATGYCFEIPCSSDIYIFLAKPAVKGNAREKQPK